MKKILLLLAAIAVVISVKGQTFPILGNVLPSKTKNILVNTMPVTTTVKISNTGLVPLEFCMGKSATENCSGKGTIVKAGKSVEKTLADFGASATKTFLNVTNATDGLLAGIFNVVLPKGPIKPPIGDDDCEGILDEPSWRTDNIGLSGPTTYKRMYICPTRTQVGIGTDQPSQALDVRGTGSFENILAPQINIGSGNFEGVNVNGLLSAGGITSSGNIVSSGIILATNGIGIGTNTLNGAKLAVNGSASLKRLYIHEDNITSLSFGSSYGANTYYATAYIGFNANRDESNGTWFSKNDGVSNGGSVIMSDVAGAIRFVNIKNTGGTNKTSTDADIVNKTNMLLTEEGRLGVGINPDVFSKVHINGNLLVTNGSIAIGNTSPGKCKLAVEGIIGAREVQVTLGNFPDYVFAKDYKLRSIKEVETYINENHHLPGIQSATEVEANNGEVKLGELNSKLLEKVEELTLYIIEQNKKIEALQTKFEAQQKDIEQLKK